MSREFVFTAKAAMDEKDWTNRFYEYWTKRLVTAHYAQLEAEILAFHKKTGLDFAEIEMVQFGTEPHQYFLRPRTNPAPPAFHTNMSRNPIGTLEKIIEVLRYYPNIGQDGQQAISCLENEILPWVRGVVGP